MTRTPEPRPAGAARFGPMGGFTAELAAAYLALLRETGNARASARRLARPYLFDNRKRHDPAFRRACAEAAAEADRRLAAATRPFPPPLELKAMPPEKGTCTFLRKSTCPPADAPADERESVIRRTSNGRLQVTHVRDGDWNAQAQDAFLARLRMTGNIGACARAVGFDLATVYRKIDAWPAFARDVRDALDEASARLDHKLVAHAHALLGCPGEEEGTVTGEEEGTVTGNCPQIPFDPEAAMRILGFLDRRRAGRTTRGRRRGPPDLAIDDAVECVLAKIEAIERHEKLMAERGDPP